MITDDWRDRQPANASPPKSHNELWAQARRRAFLLGVAVGAVLGFVVTALSALKFLR